MVKIVHLFPGRLRLRLEAVKGRPELATTLHSHLASVSHIGRVQVDTRTGSVLLLYDPSALKSPEFIDDLSAALGKVFPAHFAPGRLSVTVKRLKGRPGLAKRIEEHLSPVRGIDQIEIDPSTGTCLLVYDSSTVTSPGFLEALSNPLAVLLPHLNVNKFVSRLGLRW